jgi:hypothetical protein
MVETASVTDAQSKEKRAKMILTIAVAVVVVFVVLPVILFGAIVMWQLGVFNPGSGGGASTQAYTTAAGFSKLKPQLAGTSFTRSGQFTGIFTNAVGTKAVISRQGLIVDGMDGGRCVSVSLDETEVPAGGNFKVSANGCPQKDDSLFTLKVTIPYSVTVGGFESTRSEMGTIRGPVQ